MQNGEHDARGGRGGAHQHDAMIHPLKGACV